MIIQKGIIATTPEQAVRLLKAGISQETADCHWLKQYVKDEDGNFHDVLFTGCYPDSFQPAWSLAALWRLAKEKRISLVFNTCEDTPEDVVSLIVDALVNNK